MLPVLQLGPLAIQAPGLALLLGLWIGLELSERHAVLRGQQPGRLYHLALVGLIAGLVGARLAYAAQYPAAFLQSPLGLLSLSPQMLNGSAGLLTAALACLISIQRTRLPLWPTLDLLVSLLSTLAVAVGLAHLASGDAFGAPTNLPWAIELWGAKRHPSQLYEIFMALLVLWLVWPGAWKPLRRALAVDGVRLWAFLALSALSRIILEAFRGDSVLLWGDLRQAQVIAWAALAVSLWQLGVRFSKREAAGEAAV